KLGAVADHEFELGGSHAETGAYLPHDQHAFFADLGMVGVDKQYIGESAVVVEGGRGDGNPGGAAVLRHFHLGGHALVGGFDPGDLERAVGGAGERDDAGFRGVGIDHAEVESARIDLDVGEGG